MQVTIRRAKKEDAQEIYRFVCELEEMIFDTDLFYKYYYENISKPDYHYLVAVVEDEPIGYISCHGQVLLHHLGKVYEIQELFVDTAYRSRGIGRVLIEQLIKLLDKEPYDMLEVASGMQRAKAHEFYRKCGFEQSHYKFTKRGNKGLTY